MSSLRPNVFLLAKASASDSPVDRFVSSECSSAGTLSIHGDDGRIIIFVENESDSEFANLDTFTAPSRPIRQSQQTAQGKTPNINFSDLKNNNGNQTPPNIRPLVRGDSDSTRTRLLPPSWILLFVSPSEANPPTAKQTIMFPLRTRVFPPLPLPLTQFLPQGRAGGEE